MRVLTVSSLLALALAASAAAALAGEPPVPIEGTLLVSGSRVDTGLYAYFMEGSSDNTTPAPLVFSMGDVSPHEDQVAYAEPLDVLPLSSVDVWKADVDGANPTNLTGPEAANLGGINCWPKWSPDAGMIAFMHCLPIEGFLPCEVGFEVWVMNADGTGAHRVSPDGVGNVHLVCWSANGYRLLCDMWYAGGPCAIDIDGTELEFLPNVAAEGDWSPDGSKIVSCAMLWDLVEGQYGVWRQLRLTNADGSGLQILVEQFIRESDALDHMAALGLECLDPLGWEGCVGWNVGPTWAQFSPLGDRVAFIAAGLGTTYPYFDPEGPEYSYQNEVWIYELETGDLTRVTDDLDYDGFLSWKGHNTYPDDPEVTVDNTTVTFSEVIADGLTTIIRDDDPPEMPAGYEFAGEFYEISTTADVSGLISICMTYLEEDIPTAVAEEDLRLLRYDEGAECWVDITTSLDPIGNTICGETYLLSVLALYVGPPVGRFLDVRYTGYGPHGNDPHWAFYEIEACAEAGIVKGYEDGCYRPDASVSRGHMAVYISRAVAGGDDNVPEFTGTPRFPDVDAEHWALDYVEYAAEQNVVAGYQDGAYHPEEEVTRAQMAVYIARAVHAPEGDAGLADYVPAEPRDFADAPPTGYGDDGSEPYWAYFHIEWCVENDVVRGYEDGLYHPERIVTRDQMAVYIARAFDLVP